ncbi:MAG: aminotransferase class IV [Spirochaetia bacterium]|nr:aminotransferase class IV [Spirochaetia bacterium]
MIESIKIKNGKIYNLFYHNERMIYSRKNLLGLSGVFNINDFIEIENLNANSSVLKVITSANAGKEIAFNINHDLLYKLRIIYSKDILSAEVLPYKIRNIKSLKLINDNEIEYSHKTENRQALDDLFSKKEFCDDILIVKNNRFTDTSSANIVFFDGEKYITPEIALLKGTKREQLLDEKVIITSDITTNDLPSFQRAYLINAMIDLHDLPIEIDNIFS